MESQRLFVMVLLAGMASGVFIVVMAMRQRAVHIELGHRERMAMIERGLVPAPEMQRGLGPLSRPAGPTGHAATRRNLTGGIILVGLGVSFMILIGVAAGSPEVALGVGGAIATLGGALIVISVVARAPAPTPATPPERPDQLG